MRWPIDDQSGPYLARHLLDLGVGRQVRDRLRLERSMARLHGFSCFADYFTARQALGWGWTVWLEMQDRPGVGCVG